MTTKKEIKFNTKSDMEKYVINNRDVLYLVVDWQHLRVLIKEVAEK